MTIDLLLSMVAAGFGAAGVLWAFVRWIANRHAEIVREMVNADSSLADRMTAMERDLGGRIDQTRRDMLTKDDLQAVVRNLDKLESGLERMDGRMDQMMQLLMERRT